MVSLFPAQPISWEQHRKEIEKAWLKETKGRKLPADRFAHSPPLSEQWAVYVRDKKKMPDQVESRAS
jgi:hypothetical protein